MIINRLDRSLSYELLLYIYSFIYNDLIIEHYNRLNKNNLLKLLLNDIYYNKYIKKSNMTTEYRTIYKYLLYKHYDEFNNNLSIIKEGLLYKYIIFRNYYDINDNIYLNYDPIDITLHTEREFYFELRYIIYDFLCDKFDKKYILKSLKLEYNNQKNICYFLHLQTLY